MSLTTYQTGYDAELLLNEATKKAVAEYQANPVFDVNDPKSEDVALHRQVLAMIRTTLRDLHASDRRLAAYQALIAGDLNAVLLCDGWFDDRVDDIVDVFARIGEGRVAQVVQAANDLAASIVANDDLPESDVPSARQQALRTFVYTTILQ